jgi:hypothetical protein
VIYRRATAVWQGPLWMHGGFLIWAVVGAPRGITTDREIHDVRVNRVFLHPTSSLGAVGGARPVEQPVGQGDDEILKLGERERGSGDRQVAKVADLQQ